MNKEVSNFFIKVTIANKNGGLIDLSKQQEIEIDWSKGNNDGRFVNDKIVFVKDGQRYQIAMNAKLNKGWFEDKASSNFEPLSGENLLFANQNFGKKDGFE